MLLWSFAKQLEKFNHFSNVVLKVFAVVAIALILYADGTQRIKIRRTGWGLLFAGCTYWVTARVAGMVFRTRFGYPIEIFSSLLLIVIGVAFAVRKARKRRLRNVEKIKAAMFIIAGVSTAMACCIALAFLG